MKRIGRGVTAAALTFVCGVAATSPGGLLTPAAPPAAKQPAAGEPRVELTEWGESRAGMIWKWRNNGIPLPLGGENLSEQDLLEAKVLPLPSGYLLAGVGHTLYMIDHLRRVAWKHTEPQPLFDFAYVEATGLVYVTAGDNTMLILEAATGDVRLHEARNGSAAYGAVATYGKDVCLVMDDYSGYRSTEDYIPPVSDGVTAWRGTKMIWRHEVPPDAELRVSGDRIFAVTKTTSGILMSEIVPPKNSL